MVIELMLVLSLSEYFQWMSLCKDVRVELREAVRAEIISERDARDIMRRCDRYEERKRERERKSNK